MSVETKSLQGPAPGLVVDDAAELLTGDEAGGGVNLLKEREQLKMSLFGDILGPSRRFGLVSGGEPQLSGLFFAPKIVAGRGFWAI